SASVTVNPNTTVADAPLTALPAVTPPVPEGQTFTGLLGAFSDPDPNSSADLFSAGIAWGDGSSDAGTVVATGGGNYQVLGSHAYASAGIYHPTLTINDAGGASLSIVATVTVTELPLSAAGASLAAVVGTAWSGVVASFSDPNTLAGASD